ncbi:LOW QUALITY PROTEIN: protein cramped-like [Clupea harengus]|uniref:Protein cramped-like n=1 Tax=Clupea harengus TaxID=7950 RepID=A0A6P3VID6_CLUHA|nr:LOW QUALITY PROTEIN: protein cramped-like [Clupea harengus]
MVKRKKTSSAVDELENGMTVGQGDVSGGEGPKKPARKLEGCDEEESGDQASEETSTKRDEEEILNPSTAASSSLTLSLPTSTPNPSGPPENLQSNSSPPPVPQNQDQHHFLRSSVRPPSKRLRKDPVAPALNGHGGAKAKGAEAGPALCASTTAGPVGGSGAGGSSRSGPRGQGSGGTEEGGSQKRTRRQWESWSTEDKNSFFEGLYEHGKDFEAIQNNIALKYKKKGKPTSMVKNKEQVRHFYYRTWHKISKHIDFNNAYSRVLKKSSQELYGLICYAELRKKVGGLMDDKNVAKLNELIQQGATTVRSKGRNLRIKAPMCRALKKLCDPDGVSDEEDQKPVRLPLKVAVELQPRSNHSWTRVQSLAHNPRLRMVVELHRKVSSLIEFLKQKWAVQDQRIRKSLEEREALEGAPKKAESEELLLFPAESSTVTALPGVARVVHSKASCTVHWQETGRSRPGSRDLPTAHILGIQPGGRGVGRPGKGAAPPAVKAEGQSLEGTDGGSAGVAAAASGGENASANANPTQGSTVASVIYPVHSTCAAIPPSLPAEQSVGKGPAETEGAVQGDTDGKEKISLAEKDCAPAEQNKEEAMAAGVVSPDHAPAPPAVLPDTSTRADGDGGGGGGGGASGGGGGVVVVVVVAAAVSLPASCQRGSPERIREEGWSVQEAENVTLAELYLMLGKPGKLQLEYEWQARPQPPASIPPNTHNVLRCLLRLVASEVNPKPAPELCTVGTSPVKPTLEEQAQSLTPPGKAPAGAMRSPTCGRQQSTTRNTKLLLPNAVTTGGRNLPRSLLVSGADGDGGVFAVPTMLPPNSSRLSRMFSPNKEAELAFRQQLDSISSDFLLPKQRKLGRSRPLRKPLVVQRTLVPRTTGDTSQHVCSFSILSNSSATGTGSFRPIQPRVPLARPLVTKTTASAPSPSPSTELSSAIDLAAKSAGIIPGSPCGEMEAPAVEDDLLGPERDMPLTPPQPQTDILQEQAEESLQNSLPPPSPGGADSMLAPPSVASLLDISLPGPPEESLPSGEAQTHISDSIIELAINSAHYGDGSSMSPAKLNGTDTPKLLPSPSDSPAHSWIPSPSHDPQWYPSDSTDSSLGCLLSSLVSPEKHRRTQLRPVGPSSGTALLGPSCLDSNSHDSFPARGLPEVDTQLACMMSESSVDYIARFNDLAQELSVTESHLPHHGV